ncbi:MAG: YjgP/YjgQ family permease [Lentisphaerae bacterium]|nr:YjgP/YjgQ family permease [Lentisphaerota bacterium]
MMRPDKAPGNFWNWIIMWTLNRYITRDFLIVFGMAIGILTFGMLGARLGEVMELISRGIPLESFFKFILYTLPVILIYTIPWSILVATMVTFGRLSADSEITAMRACGVSLLQIVAPLLLFVIGMTAVCLYLQVYAGPPMLGKARALMRNTAATQPLAIFEPGKQIEFEGALLYIDDKVGKNELRGVQIYRFDDKLNRAQDIFAEQALLTADEENMILNIKLVKCVISYYADDNTKHTTFSDELELNFDYGKAINEQRVGQRAKFLPADQLLARIKVDRKRGVDEEEMCELEVELNQRIALALSPIAFLLLGLPLAIRTSRRETSVGLFLSVILGGVFFLAIIVFESLTSFPKLYPQYLIWLPNLVFQTLGAIMLYRVSQR